MGGRGSSGGGGGGGGGASRGSSDGVIMTGGTRTIETRYIEGRGFTRGRYADEVLEARTDGSGNVTFSYASGGTFEKTAKTNKTNYVTYQIQAGAVNGETFNIDWSKVNSISGQTFSLKDSAKQAGLSWDSATKTWRRKKK